jgi:hypothetical protein
MGKRTDVNPSGYHSYGRTKKEKVINFGAFIKDFGWTGSWREDEETEMIFMTATRGDSERIDIEYPVNQGWPDVYYTFAGNTIKCRNVSQAAKLAQAIPDSDKMRYNARRLSNARRRASGLGNSERAGTGLQGVGEPDENGADDIMSVLSTTLPFDKESSIEDVILALKQHRNPTIVWINRISGKIESAMMRTGKKHNRVSTNKEGKVIIQFIDERGFHSVYVESIVAIS